MKLPVSQRAADTALRNGRVEIAALALQLTPLALADHQSVPRKMLGNHDIVFGGRVVLSLRSTRGRLSRAEGGLHSASRTAPRHSARVFAFGACQQIPGRYEAGVRPASCSKSERCPHRPVAGVEENPVGLRNPVLVHDLSKSPLRLVGRFSQSGSRNRVTTWPEGGTPRPKRRSGNVRRLRQFAPGRSRSELR